MYIERELLAPLRHTLQRGKSVLLMGPRQTGKSTLIEQQVKTDLTYSFLQTDIRRQFEQHPEHILSEIKAFRTLNPDKPLPMVYIDEVQLVPDILDNVQYAIDHKLAQFVLSGSSARKLKLRKQGINFLPGRLIDLRLDALSISELAHLTVPLAQRLLYGTLPEIVLQESNADRDQLLTAYVNLYLEQEIRAEALVRNLVSFSQFLQLMAIESGNTVNINRLAERIGVKRHTLYDYLSILEDCLIIGHIEPLTDTTSRRRLSKANKYLFFDSGVRRIAAGESAHIPEKYYGALFEQFIGMECIKFIRQHAPQATLRYWQDHAGPEVDWVIELNHRFLPIEVKYTDKPTAGDARHLKKFMAEYPCHEPGLVICRVPRPMELAPNILAVPWEEISSLVANILN